MATHYRPINQSYHFVLSVSHTFYFEKLYSEAVSADSGTSVLRNQSALIQTPFGCLLRLLQAFLKTAEEDQEEEATASL